jgi:hypothetical protein
VEVHRGLTPSEYFVLRLTLLDGPAWVPRWIITPLSMAARRTTTLLSSMPIMIRTTGNSRCNKNRPCLVEMQAGTRLGHNSHLPSKRISNRTNNLAIHTSRRPQTMRNILGWDSTLSQASHLQVVLSSLAPILGIVQR